MTTLPADAAPAFRRAAAFLLHWQDDTDEGEGGAEVLNSLRDDAEWAQFVCAMAEIAWNMGGVGERDAVGYVQFIAAEAAFREACAGALDDGDGGG